MLKRLLVQCALLLAMFAVTVGVPKPILARAGAVSCWDFWEEYDCDEADDDYCISQEQCYDLRVGESDDDTCMDLGAGVLSQIFNGYGFRDCCMVDVSTECVGWPEGCANGCCWPSYPSELKCEYVEDEG